MLPQVLRLRLSWFSSFPLAPCMIDTFVIGNLKPLDSVHSGCQFSHSTGSALCLLQWPAPGAFLLSVICAGFVEVMELLCIAQ
jgi:hypothetical protein